MAVTSILRQGPGEEGARWGPAGRQAARRRQEDLPGVGTRRQRCPRPSASPPTSPFPTCWHPPPQPDLVQLLPEPPSPHTGLCLLCSRCLPKPFPHIPQGPAKCRSSTNRHLPRLRADVPHLSLEVPSLEAPTNCFSWTCLAPPGSRDFEGKVTLCPSGPLVPRTGL